MMQFVGDLLLIKLSFEQPQSTLVVQIVVDLELDDLGSARTFEMVRKLCEEPSYGRAPTLQAKNYGAVLLARWVV
ncbi:hypothetical protein ACFQD2_01365 [Pseudomonas lini]